jgi:hypothetical protein
VKLNINSVEVHPDMSCNGHPVDDVLVGALHCDLKLTGIWLSFILIIITILHIAGASSAVWNSDTSLSHRSMLADF